VRLSIHHSNCFLQCLHSRVCPRRKNDPNIQCEALGNPSCLCDCDCEEFPEGTSLEVPSSDAKDDNHKNLSLILETICSYVENGKDLSLMVPGFLCLADLTTIDITGPLFPVWWPRVTGLSYGDTLTR
jgi:hypothetical protein